MKKITLVLLSAVLVAITAYGCNSLSGNSDNAASNADKSGSKVGVPDT